MPLTEHLTLTKPDDFHLHLRDGEMLRRVVADSARRFGRAIIMPNLRTPITTTELARQYRDRILASVPGGLNFQPLMTLFLTDEMSPVEIGIAQASGIIHGVKWYPAGATTNAEHGVRAITRCYNVLAGTRGLGKWEQFFVGSTAKRLIRKCPSSVWIVKAGHICPPKVVLAATDFSALITNLATCGVAL